MASASKAKQDAANIARAARVSGIPNICKNPFMKDSAKCKMAAKKVEGELRSLKVLLKELKNVQINLRLLVFLS